MEHATTSATTPGRGVETNTSDTAAGDSGANVVVRGMVLIPGRDEVWCTEHPSTVTIRRASDPNLEVVGSIALSSKAMPAHASALCLCYVPLPSGGDGNDHTPPGSTSPSTADSHRRFEVWTSWTSGHVVMIDGLSRAAVDYLRWDPPHPVHCLQHVALDPKPLVVGVALDGCMSLWDVSSRRVVTSLAVTVGSKAPLHVVTPPPPPHPSSSSSSSSSSPRSKPITGAYVYGGFDDGSIRVFLVRNQLVSSNRAGTFRATLELADSGCLYDVHRGSVLSFALIPPTVEGGPLVVWSGGEDGTVRQTTTAGTSRRVSSAIVLHSSVPSDGHALSPQSRNAGISGGGACAYYHKIAICGSHVLACNSEGTLAILGSNTTKMLQRVQFQAPLCVRELICLDTPTAGARTMATQRVKRILLSLSDGSLRNVALRVTDSDVAEGEEADRASPARVSSSQSRLNFSPDSPSMGAPSPRDQQPTSTPLPLSSSKRGHRDPTAVQATIFAMKSCEEGEAETRQMIEQGAEQEASYLHDATVVTLGQTPAAEAALLRAAVMEQRLVAAQQHFAEREDLIVKYAPSSRKRGTSTMDYRPSASLLLESHRNGAALIEELQETTRREIQGRLDLRVEQRKTTLMKHLLDDLAAEVDAYKSQQAEAADAQRKLREELKSALEERDNAVALIKELQSAVKELQHRVSSTGDDAVTMSSEQRRVYRNTLQLQEFNNRLKLEAQWNEFWNDSVHTPLARIQSLQCERLAIDTQVACSNLHKGVTEAASLRQLVSDHQRTTRSLELKIAAAEHNASRLEHEKMAAADEAAQYRVRLAQSEAEFLHSSREHGSSAAHVELLEQKLNTTLQLAEESCQTVADQTAVIQQLNQRVEFQGAASQELVHLCNARLGAGMDTPWLAEARSLLRDSMYDLAAARRLAIAAGDRDPALSPPRLHSGPTEVLLNDTCEKYIGSAFEKVKTTLETSLNTEGWVALERDILLDAVRHVEQSSEDHQSSF